MNSIATNQNNVNTAYQDMKKDVSGGLFVLSPFSLLTKDSVHGFDLIGGRRGR